MAGWRVVDAYMYYNTAGSNGCGIERMVINGVYMLVYGRIYTNCKQQIPMYMDNILLYSSHSSSKVFVYELDKI